MRCKGEYAPSWRQQRQFKKQMKKLGHDVFWFRKSQKYLCLRCYIAWYEDGEESK